MTYAVFINWWWNSRVKHQDTLRLRPASKQSWQAFGAFLLYVCISEPYVPACFGIVQSLAVTYFSEYVYGQLHPNNLRWGLQAFPLELQVCQNHYVAQRIGNFTGVVRWTERIWFKYVSTCKCPQRSPDFPLLRSKSYKKAQQFTNCWLLRTSDPRKHSQERELRLLCRHRSCSRKTILNTCFEP